MRSVKVFWRVHGASKSFFFGLIATYISNSPSFSFSLSFFPSLLVFLPPWLATYLSLPPKSSVLYFLSNFHPSPSLSLSLSLFLSLSLSLSLSLPSFLFLSLFLSLPLFPTLPFVCICACVALALLPPPPLSLSLPLTHTCACMCSSISLYLSLSLSFPLSQPCTSLCVCCSLYLSLSLSLSLYFSLLFSFLFDSFHLFSHCIYVYHHSSLRSNNIHSSKSLSLLLIIKPSYTEVTDSRQTSDWTIKALPPNGQVIGLLWSRFLVWLRQTQPSHPSVNTAGIDSSVFTIRAWSLLIGHHCYSLIRAETISSQGDCPATA